METKEMMRIIASLDIIELRKLHLLIDGEIERRRIEQKVPATQEAEVEKISNKKPHSVIEPSTTSLSTLISKELQKILEGLTKDGSSLPQIVQRVNLPYKLVHRGIKKLQKSGKVICEGTGRGTRFRIA